MIVTFLILLGIWIEVRNGSANLCHREHLRLLKKIRSAKDKNMLYICSRELAEFEELYQGRVLNSALKALIDDLEWKITKRKSEL